MIACCNVFITAKSVPLVSAFVFFEHAEKVVHLSRDRIWNLQFGSRGKKNTAQAMFICRRLQDIIERSDGEPLTMIFLDWEKAFDKVYQDELINAVRRMNVPEKMLNALESFYRNPRFRIKDREGKSSWRKQRTGIRQGCPSHHTFL